MNPPARKIPGTEGYAEQAHVLVQRYESVPFADRHRTILPLLPKRPSSILDIGAGTGVDAAWFASQGHRVIAIEPTSELSSAGKQLHPSPSIEWIDDSLPDLNLIRGRNMQFQVIMLTAVWMHLDAAQRERAMPNLVCLLAADGLVTMTLRHGPVPAGRRMFEVSGDETIALAQVCGLSPVIHTRSESAHEANRAAGVTWTILAFQRSS